MVVLIHTSRRVKVSQILMCTAILERDTEHIKDQNDQDTAAINPAETVQDPGMVEEIVTVVVLLADHDRIRHTALSERMVAEGVSRHVYVIQRLCRPS